jgi:hypothetical protein
MTAATRRVATSSPRPRSLPALVLASTVGALIAAGSARATEWQFIGARYQGMGGAGVAVVDDALAMYWNPGALAFTTGRDVQLPFGGSVSAEGDVMQEIDRLDVLSGDLKTIRRKIRDGERLTESERQTILRVATREIPLFAEENEGFLPRGHAGLVAREKRFAFGVMAVGESVIRPFVDDQNFGLSSAPTPEERIADVVGAGADRSAVLSPDGQSLADEIADDFRAFTNTGFEQNQAEELVFSSESAGLDSSDAGIRSNLRRTAQTTASSSNKLIADNVSGAAAVTLVTAETTFAYGHPFFEKIGIGGAIRYIYGNTFVDYTSFFEVDSVRELIKETLEFNNRQDGHDFAVDLGLLVRPTDWLRFGLVARNLNEPDFAVDLPADVRLRLATAGIVFQRFELERQARFGAAVDVFPWWTIALDVDLTKNGNSYLPGFDSRFVSLGTELRAEFERVSLALRGGAFMDVGKDQNQAPTVTAGLGLRLWNFYLDFAGGIATERDRFESIGTDDSIPIRASFAGQLGYRVDF